MNELEWDLIHESVCFTYENNKRFIRFLERNNSKELIEYWIKGKKQMGHDLIGAVFREGYFENIS